VGIKDTVMSLFPGSGSRVGGRVGELIAATQAAQPEGYAAAVDKVNAYYLGQTDSYVREALARQFPQDAPHMQVVELELAPRIICEQSRVFAGDGKYELERDGAPVEEAGGVKWADVLKGAGWSRESVELNRATTANKLLFVRVSWDEVHRCVVLTKFLPNKTFIEFSDEVRSVDAAKEIAFELEPVVVDGKRRRRFERWTADNEPVFEVLDENGKVLRQQANEYRGPDGRGSTEGTPLLPVVEFRASDPDWGRWPMPDEALVAAAETVNADLTNARYIARQSAYGQWVGETVDAENTEPWPAKVDKGPGRIMKAPKGKRLTHIAQQAPIVELDVQTKSYVEMVTSTRQLPPGSVLASGRQVPSGVALQIERAPLHEFRKDQIELFSPSVHRLLDLIRIVWNAHQDSDPTRFLGCKPRWTPGAVREPVTDEEQARVDEAEIRIGVSSPVRVLMRKNPTLTREAAMKLAAEIAEENRVRTAGSLADFGRRIAAEVVPPAGDDEGKDEGAAA
jgi:hypothetical protein